jgi:hypothetical protein
LLFEAVTISAVYGVGWQDELKGIWKETVVTKRRYYAGVSLEGLRKTLSFSVRITVALAEYEPSV